MFRRECLKELQCALPGLDCCGCCATPICGLVEKLLGRHLGEQARDKVMLVEGWP
jgi:hypothetical protein